MMQHQIWRATASKLFQPFSLKMRQMPRTDVKIVWLSQLPIYLQTCAPSASIPPVRIILTSPSTTTGCQNASHLRSMRSWGTRLHPPVSPLMSASKQVRQALQTASVYCEGLEVGWRWEECSIDSSCHSPCSIHPLWQLLGQVTQSLSSNFLSESR